MTEVIKPAETDDEWLSDALSRRPTKRRNLTIPEHAETTIVPTGKYRGVKFKNDRAPYMIKPMECLSPQSNIQEVRLMWPAQTGKSTVGEQATLYYIQELPSEILYVGSDERQSRKWLEKRIATRAKHLGIEFRSQTDDKNSRKSGDTMFSKDFDGGNIDAASSRSPAQLASETKRFVNADEPDRWKQTLGAEGFTWDIMYARTQAWGDQRKILATSTPTTFEESLIYRLWEEGTREEYFVPCPHCGKKQMLDIKNLKYIVVGRSIKNEHVWYECTHCQEAIEESKKYEMLNNGEWIPQGEPLNSGIVSFHINAIYSPFKMWIDIAYEYEKAKEDPMRMHTFTNLVMGLPYQETGARPKIDKVISHRGTYNIGEVHNDALWITAGADVQRGKTKYNTWTDDDIRQEVARIRNTGGDPWDPVHNLPRIEIEVVAHGSAYRTWSIEYKVFFGDTSDPYSGAWLDLMEWMNETRITYKRADGSEISCSMVLIDSGDGMRTSAVYSFCEQHQILFPCKGDQALKKRKDELGDQVTGNTFMRYRYTPIGSSQYLITVSTNYYKTLTYLSLDIPRGEEDPQPPRFADFPKGYPDHYFKMLTSEEKHQDGSFHAGDRRNEALDCRVYALAGADYWLDSSVKKYREAYVKAGSSKQKVDKIITTKYVIEHLVAKRAKEHQDLTGRNN